jgi:two-component system OmpR family sensor kinase
VGLRTRLALLFAATVAVLVTAGGALLIEQLSFGVDSALDSSLTVRADALAQQVGPDGLVADFQDSGGDSGSLLPANTTLAQVIGATGGVVESSEGAGSRPLLTSAQLANARSGAVAVTWVLAGGEEVRLLAVPVPDSGNPPMVVVVGGSRRVATEAVSRVQTALWLGGPAAVIVGGIGAWLVAGAVLRPVERMRATAAEISAADSDARLVVPAGRDEIARLGETMNALLERLQQALSHQRAFVADAGHELRTPLTMLRTELELAARPGRDKDSLIAAVQAASMDTDRLIRLAEDLLTLARADSAQVILHREPLELAAVVVDSVTGVTALARSKSVDLELALSPVSVMGDRDRLRQVVDNLLDNAIRHAPPGSTLTVTLSAHAAPTGAVLRVMDEGPGFPKEFLPHAFDRFTRADPARTDGSGAGLGLAIVASLVGAHGGTVAAGNRPAGGACVRVELPLTVFARRTKAGGSHM